MTNLSKDILKLREDTGVGMQDAKEALLFCNDFDVAKEYLRLSGQALCRYKIVDEKKVPFEKEDFFELAIKNVEFEKEKERE